MMDKLVQFGKEMVRRLGDADVSGLSAQLAYFFLLSLFPFLLFLITLLGYFPIDERAVMETLDVYLPNEVKQMIESNLTTIMNKRSGSLLSLSIIGTLWSASNGFNAVKKSFNQAFAVENDQSFIIARIISIGLMILMLFFIGIALLLQVFGELISHHVFNMVGLSETFTQSWDLLRWIATSVTFFIVFSMLYKLGPNIKIKWRHIIWGTIFATVGWQMTS